MTKIAVTQRCCEWMALIGMCNMLVSSPADMIEVLSKDDAIVFGASLVQIERGMPAEGLICNSTACVLFEEGQVSVLAKVVDWYDGYLLSMSERLMKYNEQAFAAKFQQTGLIKRNLKLYAKPHTNSEKKHNGDDATHDTETGGGAGQ